MPANQNLAGLGENFAQSVINTLGVNATAITDAAYALGQVESEIDVNNASNSVALTLPDPTALKGRAIRIKKVNLTGGAYSITLVRYASESIENVADTYTLPGSSDSALRAWDVVSNGTNWYVRGDRTSATVNDLDVLARYPSYGLKHYSTLGSDFASVTALAPFYSTVSGAGAALAASTATAGRVGVITLGSGTTTTGYASLNTDPASIVLGNGAVRFRCDIQLSALSDGTNTYTARFGLGDVATGAEPVDGVYFRYVHSANSGNWVLVARANNVETGIVNSTIAVAATTWTTLEIEINAAGTSCTYYVNGVLAGTTTATIPTGAGRETGVQMSILKSAGIVSRLISLDQAWIRQAASTNV
jgi:hypothetical protein